MPLEPEELIHLTAAQGYVALGMFLDADAELDRIDGDIRHLPEVLAVRMEIYKGLEKWAAMQAVAKNLATKWNPENVDYILQWAYATRRAQSVIAGLRILEEYADTCNANVEYVYTVACYVCQTGDVARARIALTSACRMEPSLRLRALNEKDLAPLWDAL